MLHLAVSFGELDISPATIGFMVGITLFIFLAAGVSSLNLIRSLLNNKDET